MSRINSTAPKAIFGFVCQHRLWYCEMYDSTMPAQTSINAAPAASVKTSTLTARNRSRRRTLAVPANQSASHDESRLARNQNSGYLNNAVRQKPAQQKLRLTGMHVIEADSAQGNAVRKQDDQGTDAPGEAQCQRSERYTRVVRHQHGGERSMNVAVRIFGAGLLIVNPLFWIAQQMLKGRIPSFAPESQARKAAPRIQPKSVTAKAI